MKLTKFEVDKMSTTEVKAIKAGSGHTTVNGTLFPHYLTDK